MLGSFFAYLSTYSISVNKEEQEMKKVYFTVSGTNFHHGTSFAKEGMKVTLVKEPDNKFDCEAITVKMEGLDAIGHVANSCRTVTYGNYSAGRLYDKIEDYEPAVIEYVFCDKLVCSINIKE